MPALHVVRELELHVVAEVVEPELVVGAVRDVRRVGDLALRVVQVVLDDADRHAQEAVDTAHPLRIAAREVVVDGDDVHALAFEGVEIRRSVATSVLPSPVFISAILPLCRTAPPMSWTSKCRMFKHAAACFADDREGFGHHVVQRFTLGQPFPECGRLGAELFVGESLDRRLECVDLSDDRTQTLELPLV